MSRSGPVDYLPEEDYGYLRHNPDVSPTDKEIFAFLKQLRESGKTNMYAGQSYLRHYFALSEEESSDFFWKWVEHLENEALLEKLISTST